MPQTRHGLDLCMNLHLHTTTADRLASSGSLLVVLDTYVSHTVLTELRRKLTQTSGSRQQRILALLAVERLYDRSCLE